MTCDQVLVSRELGGAGILALRIADELRRRAGAARVWVPGEGVAARSGRDRGLEVRLYDGALISGAQGRLRAAIGNLAWARGLRAGGRRIVHVHSPHAYRLLLPGLLAARTLRVAHVHIDEEPEGLRWSFRRPPHLIITCARFLIDPVRRALPAPVRRGQWIEAVPNAVDTRRFAPGDKREAKRGVGAPVDVPMAVMLANLAPHKGQETAIRATARLRDAGVPIQCWLAGVERGGGTAYTDRLRAMIAELAVGDRVRLLGHRDDAEVLLRAADFFLLPSTHEGLPLSVLEAQASEVVVLAAPTAGIPEVVADGETGFLIAADDVEGYAGRIRALVEHPEMSRRVASRARARTVAERSGDAYCERMLGLYRELLTRP